MKPGRKHGQHGARVKRTGKDGNHASFQLNGPYEAYHEFWEFLDACSETSGLALRKLVQAVKMYRDVDRIEEISKKLDRLLAMDFHGGPVHQAESEDLQAEVDALMEHL